MSGFRTDLSGPWGESQGRPGFFAPSGATGVSTITLTAGRLYAMRFFADHRRIVSGLSFVIGVSASANDPVYTGLLDKTGARIATSASTTGQLQGATGAAARHTVSFTASVEIKSDEPYYATLLCPTVGGTAAQLLAANYVGATYALLGGSTLPDLEVAQLDGQTTIPSTPALGIPTITTFPKVMVA